MAYTRNISLIGMPGVGKSTVGKLLAKKLLFNFLDTDTLIQNQKKLPLHSIIQESGEADFITLEESIILKLSHLSKTLISPGGSVVYSEKSMLHLRTLSYVIYLEDKAPSIEKRIHNMQSRGIIGLKNNDLEALFHKRHALYLNYAHACFSISNYHLSDAALYTELISLYSKVLQNA